MPESPPFQGKEEMRGFWSSIGAGCLHINQSNTSQEPGGSAHSTQWDEWRLPGHLLPLEGYASGLSDLSIQLAGLVL